MDVCYICEILWHVLFLCHLSICVSIHFVSVYISCDQGPTGTPGLRGEKGQAVRLMEKILLQFISHQKLEFITSDHFHINAAQTPRAN